MGKKFKRSRLWVDGPFQARLLLRLACYFLLYMFVVFHIGFLCEVVNYVCSNGMDKVTGDLYVDFLLKQRPLLIGLVIVAPAFFYDLIKFSHRVAGPLYRCRNVMREMAAGKPVAEFIPRKYDLLTELFQAFNALIKEWNARIAATGNERPGDPAPVESAVKVVGPSSVIHAGAEPQESTV